ncbi:MAG: site-specific DNA-methyltransferase, partial [Bacteroidetes bacterium]|nr:site-specific DNA-methyltransferase [Bacteroidota bacterium]
GKDFVYKDNFSKDTQEELFESGQKDEYNQRLIANPETAGRYHSDWLSMMYPRLKLARNLLTTDGVILISIGEDELGNLKSQLCDIFGEFNYVSSLLWEKGRKNDSRFFSHGHEYILVFAKDKEYLINENIYWREEKPGAREIYNFYLMSKQKHSNDFSQIEKELRAFYKNLPKEHPSKKHSRYSHVDQRGVWRDDNMSLPRGGARYEVIHPVTGKPCAIPPGGWRYASLEIMQEKIDQGFVVFREDHTEPPVRKTYLVRSINENTEEPEIGLQVLGTYFYRSGLQATNELNSIFGRQRVFNNPKDHEILSKLINYCTGRDNEAIILDFFSGSASSAHAVLELNSIDSGNRRFIQVQLPEATDEKSEAFKAGYKNICEIGKERIRRAAKKIKEELQAKQQQQQGKLDFEEDTTVDISKLDFGFRVYRLDSSNMQDVYYRPQDYKQEAMELFADNIKADRTPDDLLAQVMLDWGLSLSLKIEQQQLQGKLLFKVAGNSLFACFDDGIDEAFAKAVAPEHPLRIVFRDKGFSSDTAKVNVKQLLKQLSPETEMKVI